MKCLRVRVLNSLALCLLLLCPVSSPGGLQQETVLTYRADPIKLKRFFLNPAFLSHLKQTKTMIPRARFEKMYSLDRGIPKIHLVDGRIMRLMPASLQLPPTQTEIRGSLQILPDIDPFSDYIFGGFKPGIKAPPDVADHRLAQTPIRNQNPRSTCVAHASLAAMEVFPNIPDDLSEEYAYHHFMMNFPPALIAFPQTCTTDWGFFISLAAKLLGTEGVCEEEFWEYTDQKIADCPDGHQPPDEAVNATKYKITKYQIIPNLSGVTDVVEGTSLRAYNGRFVCADKSRENTLVADRPRIGPWEAFEIVPLDGKRAALKAWNGNYVCADAGRGDILVADRTEVGPWETFEIVHQGGGRIALKAHNGRFVCSDKTRGDILVADRVKVGEWEIFERIDHSERLNIKNTDYLESLLATGHNIVYTSWVLWDTADHKGILDVRLDDKGNPLLPDKYTGSHAMLIVGYNRPRKYFIVKNSWSEGWGHNGYGFFHYDYVKAYSHSGFIILETKGN